jgi:SagB-type dehydrogenase family enzyme
MTSYRKYLKNLEYSESDQQKGLPPPPIQKPYPQDANLVDLVPPAEFSVGHMALIDAINARESRRIYTDESLSLEELSFLLWTTQGVRKLARNGLVTLRNAPSGGAMHPFETYLLVKRVDGLAPGIYRYLAIEHKLYPESAGEAQKIAEIGEICYGQQFVGKGAVVFIWTARPYRTEWRYAEDSVKDILISVGHICQNLYLACEAIGAGTCAILAYDQGALEQLIGVDGEEEIALYLAPVGKVAKS